MERIRGARELGDDFGETLSFAGGGVAAAERGDFVHGLEAFLTGAERVFVAGDADSVGGHCTSTANGLTIGFLSHCVFVVEGHGGGASDELRDAAARDGRERRGVEVHGIP